MLKEGLRKVPNTIWQRLLSGPPNQRALRLSLALHLGVTLMSLSHGLIQELRAWLKPQAAPLHVFSLESLPRGDTLGLATSPHLDSQPASQPLSQKLISKKKQVPSIHFQPLPKPKTPPLSLSKTPQKVDTLGKAKPPAPAKDKSSPKLSYEEFLKSQDKSLASIASAKGHSFNQAKLSQALQSPSLSRAQTIGSGTGSPLGAYIGQMKAVIDAVWKKPPGLKGGIEALVEFEVNAHGAVTRYTILKRSQHALFDASIELVFQSGLILPPPPSGQQVFQLTFKSLES